jgi:predicted nucleic acid-binding protein
MSVIISNTTPINYLVLIDHIAVLHHLYAHVIIPQAVFGELQSVSRYCERIVLGVGSGYQ